MSRVPYLTRDALPEAHRDLFDRFETDRARPVSNLVRALAHSPAVMPSRLAFGAALRDDTVLDPKLRELAIMTVGRITEAEYEFVHHWNRAIREGVRRGQLEALADFETSSEFDDRERAVMRYAAEATVKIKVADDIWAAIASFLDTQCLVELVLTVAWYNQTARVVVPLQIDVEEDFKLA